jgi:hypothetical protein
MASGYAEYVHEHPPRCIAGLCPRATQRPKPTALLPPHLSVFRTWWGDEADAAFFALGCPCGHRVLSLLAYPGPAGHRGLSEGLTGPLSVRCPACGTSSVLFDTRQHGYDGEQGCNTYAVGTGEAGRYKCPCCAGEEFFLCAGFSYSEPDELAARWHGRGQDYFAGFYLLGQCHRCSALVEIVSFECA